MHSSLMVYEMAATVERERLVKAADLSRLEMVAQAGRDGGLTARVRMIASALVRRAGRPQHRGAAPAAGRTDRLEQATKTGAHIVSATMTTARL